ncbi:hypothetical protein TKS_59620 [Burkholderia pseudomallei]|nr:hypothetical protein TKS_59620 [Burkholderia pseudomallei]
MRIAEALCARIVETRVDASAARSLPGSGAVRTARASADISGLVRLAEAGGALSGARIEFMGESGAGETPRAAQACRFGIRTISRARAVFLS